MLREDLDLRLLAPAQVDRVLRNWSRWHRGETVSEGYADHVPIMGDLGGVHCVADMEDNADAYSAQIADAVVWSLDIVECSAICVTWHVASVFRFRMPIEEVLPGAIETFWRMAQRRLT